MKQVLHQFWDNAMFYKDITQWLRRRTFGVIFFGLLLVALIFALFAMFTFNLSNPGASMFYKLFVILIVYGILIGMIGNGVTAKEFINRTFELYELSGISLEGMVGGKLLSLLYQFLFGFFCLVPFMCFAYYLGGLDFFEMIVVILLVCLMALPFFLVTLNVAFNIRVAKSASPVMKFLLFFFLLFTVIPFLELLFGASGTSSFMRDITNFFKSLFGGNWDNLLIFIGIILVYTQFCLLMFYTCCDNISRDIDSRAIPVRFFMITLAISWFVTFYLIVQSSGASVTKNFFMTFPLAIILLGVGVRDFFCSAATPPVVIRRYQNAGKLRQTLFKVFKPNIQGGFRSFLLLWLIASVGTWYIMETSFTGSKDFVLLSIIVQTPWFLASARLMLQFFPKQNTDPKSSRVKAVLIWVLTGVLGFILMAWIDNNSYSDSSIYMVMLATLLSPLTSILSSFSSDRNFTEFGPLLRIGSGFVGIIMMYTQMRMFQRTFQSQYQQLEAAVGTPVVPGDMDDNADQSDAT